MVRFWLLLCTVSFVEGILDAELQEVKDKYSKKVKPKPCLNLPSGLNQLNRGVDITHLDLMNLDYAKSSGWKSPVVDYSCNEGKVWRNSYDRKIYDVPDQVWTVSTVPGAWVNNAVRIFRSFLGVKNNFADVVGLKHENGMFSQSPYYLELTAEIMNKSRLVSDVSSFMLSTEALLQPKYDLETGEHFKSALQKLPLLYESNPKSYQEFIDTYGTHYFTQAKFGPFLRIQFSISKDYANNHDAEFIKNETVTSFVNWFKSHAARHPPGVLASDDFASNTQMKVFVYGGEESELIRNGLLSWMKSAVNTPSVFMGRLRPIQDLISNEIIRESMRKAVEIHLDRKYLSELRSILDNAISMFLEYGNVDHLMKVLREVAKEAEKDIPDHGEVQRLGERVRFLVVAPDWWKETSVCFKYYPDVNGKHCSGRSPTCASVDHFTSEFQDWSRNAGGCHMSWGIFSARNFDPWFEKVQICFKYVPTGDEGQCGNGSLGEICTPLNEYSVYYYDHTDNRRGGCEMAWKLHHPQPEEAPTWFLNALFCIKQHEILKSFAIRRDTEELNSCAIVNSYTDRYVDESYFRSYLFYRENYIRWGIVDRMV